MFPRSQQSVWMYLIIEWLSFAVAVNDDDLISLSMLSFEDFILHLMTSQRVYWTLVRDHSYFYWFIFIICCLCMNTSQRGMETEPVKVCHTDQASLLVSSGLWPSPSETLFTSELLTPWTLLWRWKKLILWFQLHSAAQASHEEQVKYIYKSVIKCNSFKSSRHGNQ